MDLKVSSLKVKRDDGGLCNLRLVRTENIYGYSTMVRQRFILCSNIANEPLSDGDEELYDVDISGRGVKHMIIDEVEKCFTSNLLTNGAVPVNIQKVEISKDIDILVLAVNVPIQLALNVLQQVKKWLRRGLRRVELI